MMRSRMKSASCLGIAAANPEQDHEAGADFAKRASADCAPRPVTPVEQLRALERPYNHRWRSASSTSCLVSRRWQPSYKIDRTMIPVLLRLGPITIYSYGLMMAMGFIVGDFLLTRECRRRGISTDFANANRGVGCDRRNRRLADLRRFRQSGRLMPANPVVDHFLRRRVRLVRRLYRRHWVAAWFVRAIIACRSCALSICAYPR